MPNATKLRLFALTCAKTTLDPLVGAIYRCVRSFTGTCGSAHVSRVEGRLFFAGLLFADLGCDLVLVVFMG